MTELLSDKLDRMNRILEKGNKPVNDTDTKIDITITDAFNRLKKALNDDPDYAWSWHCNIAVAYQDEGGTHQAANRAAARFMRNCFDADANEYDPDLIAKARHAEPVWHKIDYKNPVTLPRQGKPCYFISDGVVYEGYRRSDGFNRVGAQHHDREGDVTHWMPAMKPRPPKKEEEEEEPIPASGEAYAEKCKPEPTQIDQDKEAKP
jgi:hypothetical protein